MNILFLEPFYSGSHKTWLNQLKANSKHHIDLLTMEGKFWKWRMYGSAVTMSKMLEDYEGKPDLIIASDMIDLANFIALSRHRLSQLNNPKIGLYFHENQLAYPWQENSEDISGNRDVHYGMVNYSSALSADFIMFNSSYNRDSLIKELNIVLSKMPDYNHIKDYQTLDLILAKSTICPIGFNEPVTIDSASIDRLYNNYPKLSKNIPLILWNHRLDHDKNPEEFFETLISLSNNGYSFQLAILGEMTKRNLKKYKEYIDDLEKEIVALGYLSYEEYLGFLTISDILPVTSNHDFFGISVMEGIAYKTYPLLPDRLTYPTLYKINKHPEIFYKTKDQLYEKLVQLLINKNEYLGKTYTHLTLPYQWKTLINFYDDYFDNL